MSLLELIIVVAILGLLSVAAVTRYGQRSISNGGAEGFTRKLALSLEYARQLTISSGENHYVKFSSSGGVTSYAIVNRVTAVQVDQTRNVPEDLTVLGSTELEFDFDGSALATYNIVIMADNRIYNVIVDQLPGSVHVVKLN